MSFLSALRPIAAAAAIAALAIPATLNQAQASVITTVTYSPYGLPTSTGGINSIDLSGRVGQTSFTVNSGANAVAVTTANGGAIVQGSSNGNYAMPVTGGTSANPTYWTAPYTSSGGAPGTVTFSFASAQSYFGLLWGSIGTGDYLSFLNGSTEIARISGTTAMQSAAGFNNAGGAQGFGGSQYTLVNLTGGQFTSVVMGQSGLPSFEAANFQYAAQNVNVPEPATLSLLGVGLAGIGMIRRRKA